MRVSSVFFFGLGFSFANAVAITNIICHLQNPENSQFIGDYDPDNLEDYTIDLSDNGVCRVPAGPGRCVRVACGNTTGIFVCNDNNFDIAPDCRDVAEIVGWPGHGTQLGGGGTTTLTSYCTPPGNSGSNGQAFTDQGYNVVAAYANCNKDPNLGPFKQ